MRKCWQLQHGKVSQDRIKCERFLLWACLKLVRFPNPLATWHLGNLTSLKPVHKAPAHSDPGVQRMCSRWLKCAHWKFFDQLQPKLSCHMEHTYFMSYLTNTPLFIINSWPTEYIFDNSFLTSVTTNPPALWYCLYEWCTKDKDQNFCLQIMALGGRFYILHSNKGFISGVHHGQGLPCNFPSVTAQTNH